MKKILIAPNAFKHALTAAAAADAIARGLAQTHSGIPTHLFPIADGGDGTAQVFHQHAKGIWREVGTMDALGRSVRAGYSLIHEGQTAVMDMAAASGIALIREAERDPLHAHSFGTGLLIKDALDQGVKQLLIGVGGSATNDGGTGILRALGVRFLNADEEEIIYPADLHTLHRVDVQALDARLALVECVVLCDVQNPLLGDEGATRVFGPQKGLSADGLALAGEGLEALARVTQEQFGINIGTMKHGGAAGGAAAGMFSFMRARLVPGIDYLLETMGFAKHLQQARLVITGEGSLDAQTLQGKAPYGVALMAKEYGIPVVAMAGRIADEAMLQPLFHQCININPLALPLNEMLANTAVNLERAAQNLEY